MQLLLVLKQLPYYVVLQTIQDGWQFACNQILHSQFPFFVDHFFNISLAPLHRAVLECKIWLITGAG